MTPPALKFSYFSFSGRGEITRLALVYGGIPFEDDRVDFVTFGELKQTCPLGQLPLLEVDDKTFPQSMAIARYAGRLAGIYPTDPLAALKVDVVLETMMELLVEVVQFVHHNMEAAEKEKKRSELTKARLPQIYSSIEKHVEGEYLLGNVISLGDLHLFDITSNMVQPNFPDFDLASFPKVQGIINAVASTPSIAKYMAERPTPQF
ncbi:hypothetical protein Poli38472_002373 [Pythium oligandrum]|uniref:Glutathione S-transferase n=1 Tax=Pythium oligandrum TaxID=41045 RepID=A0A8K1CJM3_PYTOL|nr:hypothetical protein Poli38472_002373 [Pythium oligandrum]|eukprot:TMW63432.1 hypothetical protein Poli38472_002373 [Pythium oligandrum]